MKLEELKNTWQQYDQKLEEHLQLNEKLFKNLHLEKSRRSTDNILKWEIINSIICLILFIISAYWIKEYINKPILLISAIALIIFCSLNIILSLKKIIALINIDYYNLSVFELQKKIVTFKKRSHRFRIIELASTPLALGLGTLIPQSLFGIDISQFPVILGMAIGSGSGIGWLLALWLYKNIYEKPLANTNRFLHELEEFEQE